MVRSSSPRAAALPRPLAAAVVLSGVLATGWVAVGGDRTRDVFAPLGSRAWLALGLAVGVPLLACAHFVCAAIALRAASDRSPPLTTTLGAQLAAAATNRIVPNGVGGAAVNARFLQRHGSSAGAAASTMGLLALLGGLTDAGYAAFVTSAGPAAGVNGAGGEFARLAAHGIHAGRQVPWLGLALALPVLVIAVRRGLVPRRAAVAAALAQAATYARAVVRQPRRVLLAAAASVGTTIAVSAAFVVTVAALGHNPTPPSAGALIAVYLIGAAVGGSAPLPPVFGLTEAALVGGLTLTGYTFGSAILATLVFRLVTYWSALPLGVLATRRLHARGLL